MDPEFNITKEVTCIAVWLWALIRQHIPSGPIHNAFNASGENVLKSVSHLGFLFKKHMEMTKKEKQTNKHVD